MIDIVFLLIIFFMTVTQVSEINKEQLELPKLAGTEDQKPTLLTINVSEDGDLVVSGESISIGRLVALVEQQVLQTGRNPSLLSVVVRSDQRGASRMTNEVIRALAQLGVAKVRIAVEKKH
jgi:biopolymer transport protein ExbD